MSVESIIAVSIACKKALTGRTFDGEINHYLNYPSELDKSVGTTGHRSDTGSSIVRSETTENGPVQI